MPKPPRDRANGQYTHSQMDALCVCGHTLGKHASDTADGQRPCFNGDDGDECGCERFRKSRKRSPAPLPAADTGGPSLDAWAVAVFEERDTCERCGRLQTSRGCTAHVAPVSCRVKPKPNARCGECGGPIPVEAFPGDSAVCSSCKSPLVFSPMGWVHAAR